MSELVLVPQSISIGYVLSKSDNTKKYTIIQMPDGHWECNCKAFYHGDRATPCKHIERLRSLDRVPKGEMVLKSIDLTKKGAVILAEWRKRNGMPEVKE